MLDEIDEYNSRVLDHKIEFETSKRLCVHKGCAGRSIYE